MRTKKEKAPAPVDIEVLDRDADPGRVHDVISRMLLFLAKRLGDKEPKGPIVNIDVNDLMRRVGAALDDRAAVIQENDLIKSTFLRLHAEIDRLRVRVAELEQK